MEVVVRAAVVFVFLFFVTRVVGKRELGGMSSFELLLLVTMGDLVQQGVTQEDMSLTGAALAVGTFTILSVGFGYASFRWRRLRPVLEGAPVVIVRDGGFDGPALRAERMTEEEVLAGAREQGITDLADVDLGVLEPDGKLSFFTRRARSPRGTDDDRTPL